MFLLTLARERDMIFALILHFGARGVLRTRTHRHTHARAHAAKFVGVSVPNSGGEKLVTCCAHTHARARGVVRGGFIRQTYTHGWDDECEGFGALVRGVVFVVVRSAPRGEACVEAFLECSPSSPCGSSLPGGGRFVWGGACCGDQVRRGWEEGHLPVYGDRRAGGDEVEPAAQRD